jgi:hypothetical protein
MDSPICQAPLITEYEGLAYAPPKLNKYTLELHWADQSNWTGSGHRVEVAASSRGEAIALAAMRYVNAEVRCHCDTPPIDAIHIVSIEPIE